MKFETVYKIKDKLFKDKKGDFFLKKKDLNKLTRSGEEYKLLYFLRKSYYKTFHDFPVLGSSETALVNSSVEGPFASPPKTKKENFTITDYSEEIIEKIIKKVPDSFERVELVGYGIRSNSDFAPILVGKIDETKVRETGENSLKKLKEISKVVKKDISFGRPIYNSLVDGCVVKFVYSENGFYYPSVDLRVLGLEENKPQEIIKKLELYNLEDAFKYHEHKELGLNRCTQKGLADGFLAHLFLIKDLGLDLNKISELDNIIL